MKGFREYDYIEYAENISVLYSEFEETFNQHQISEDIFQEVNKFSEEMMALQLEEEGERKIGLGKKGEGCALQLVPTFL